LSHFVTLRLCYAPSHSDEVHVHATAPCSACALTQARPRMSCIHLVIFTTDLPLIADIILLRWRL